MERMPKYGRSPDTLAILPGLSPIVGSTEAEAKRKEAELDELILPAVGVWMLSEQMQFRLYDYALDAPLPSDDIRASGQAFTPRVVSLMDRADREGLTVRACANLVAKSRSHGTFVGTVERLVDHMQHWQDERRMRRLQHHAGMVSRTSWMCSSIRWCRYCNGAVCSARSTRARRCAIISGCRIRSAVVTACPVPASLRLRRAVRCRDRAGRHLVRSRQHAMSVRLEDLVEAAVGMHFVHHRHDGIGQRRVLERQRLGMRIIAGQRDAEEILRPSCDSRTPARCR